MTAPWMPPLPEPDGYMRHTPVWAEDSMRQAQADAARAALEQARVALRDARASLHGHGYNAGIIAKVDAVLRAIEETQQ